MINVDVELVRIPRHKRLVITIEKDFIVVRGGIGELEGVELQIRTPVNVRIDTGG
ncbi:MAG: hypothetical protein ACXAEN_24285 [Candidatus Thorarchaeota archaeon]